MRGYAGRMDGDARMRKFRNSRPWLAGALLACAMPVPAGVLTLEVDRLDTPVAGLDALIVDLDWPEDQPQGALSLRAGSLDAGEFGYRWRDLVWDCELRRQAGDWQCSGPVRARGASGLSLAARLQAGAIVLEASRKSAAMRFTQPAEDGTPLRIELVRVPADWLAPLLARAWEQGRPTGGTVDLDWQLRVDEAGIELSGPITLAAVGVDSSDGTIAAEGVNATGQVRSKVNDDAVRVELDLRLGGGEVLLGPLYAALPATPIELGMVLGSGANDRWRIEGLRWRDPGVLEAGGALTLDLAADDVLRDAQLQFSLASLKTAHARYFDSLAGSFGLAGLAIAGSARGQLEWRDAAWHALDVELEQLQLADGQGRFGVEALSGVLRLRQAAASADSDLAWQSARVYGLEFGSTSLALRSTGGGLALRAPAAIPLFEGMLDVGGFSYRPGARDDRLDLSLTLDRVGLGALSSAFGWPEFAGTISGELPGVRLAGNHLEFEGGLSARVFDGQVRVARLSLERPFGVAPMLAASIEFSDLDLQPLTAAFGFGEITGRLDGHVRDLRLLDWEPVAFDAAFRTVKRSGVRQRISQRAVRDLTEVGGGGIAAGLQAQVLKAFSSFGYDRIGLSCVLVNNVCRMGGVEPAAGGGYAIVEGSGLPRVSVIGHQTQVDWPVLLGRLKAATEGQMPVID